MSSRGDPIIDIEAALFDFDGTLVESMDVKAEAFRTLYAPFGDALADSAVAYYRANGGVPRSFRFKACHERFLGRTPPDREIEQLGAQFGAMVEAQVIAADWVPGAREFLEQQAEHVPLFLVSATPQAELDRIVEARGIGHYFADVLGSPPAKVALVHDLLSAYWFDRARVVMVGDSRADMEAAHAAGVRFVGRVRPGDVDPYLPDVTRIADLKGLAALLAG